ncbi:hypothetical protein [Leptospira limi]|uniref:Glycosyltransferase RgtA/B/C/D-like domain-containing protein n=1 Tax=Leptospira limi TaxID=2950023 RepID=A0ABT3LVV4_9LEPT|nr:hypothetical protein [Leptospira limi]MCW7461850.1 hypothetical protein [Leptospira limi]
MALILLPNILTYERQRDIQLYDETFYLESGNHITDVQDGVSYFTYYKLLNFFFKNPVDRYFVGYVLLVYLVSFAFIFTANTTRELFVNISFLAILLTSPLVLSAMPFITLFSSFLLLILIYAFYHKKYVLFLILGFVLAYARVEFFGYALFSIFFILPYLIKNKNKTNLSIYITFCIGLIVSYFKNPSSHERAYIAFCQHYAFSKFNKGLYNDDPWTTCGSLILKDFGREGHMEDILFGNFAVLLEHMGSNLIELFKIVSVKFNVPVLIVVILAVVVLSFEFLRVIRNVNKKRWSGLSQSLLVLALMSVTMFGPIFYFPRDHYLIQIFVVFLTLSKRNSVIIKNIFISLGKRFDFRLIISVILVVVFYLFFTGIKSFKKLRDSSLTNECGTLRLIETFKYAKLGKINVLNPEGDFCAYFGKETCKSILPYEKQNNFNQFIETKNVNVIIYTDYFDHNPEYREDDEFKSFVRNQFKINSKIKFIEDPMFTCKYRKVLIREM